MLKHSEVPLKARKFINCQAKHRHLQELIGVMIVICCPAPISTSALIENAAATVGGLQFPDTANYRLLDTENDGIYEALSVDVDVEITQAGSYTIGCELRKNGQIIRVCSVNQP
jgi:hypothetical protein